MHSCLISLFPTYVTAIVYICYTNKSEIYNNQFWQTFKVYLFIKYCLQKHENTSTAYRTHINELLCLLRNKKKRKSELSPDISTFMFYYICKSLSQRNRTCNCVLLKELDSESRLLQAEVPVEWRDSLTYLQVRQNHKESSE